jgi:hypothetical protein
MDILMIKVEEDIDGEIKEKIVVYEVAFNNGNKQILKFAAPFKLSDDEAIEFVEGQAKEVIAYLETQSCNI